MDNDEQKYKKQPNNLEVEQALLGAVLINNYTMERISDFLEPQHFFEPVHGRIFEAMQTLSNKGDIIDPKTLKQYFENDEDLENYGGGGYIIKLAGSATTIINAGSYGKTIYDLAIRRELINIGEDIVLTAYDSPIDLPSSEQIEQAETELFALTDKNNTGGGFDNLSKLTTLSISNIERAYQDPNNVSGKTTGIDGLDKALGGLHDTDLLILAGRPAMGKSALATNIAFNCAKKHFEDNSGASQGTVTGLFSLEMSGDQLTNRILADVAGVDSEKLKNGHLNSEEFRKVVQAGKEIEKYPLYIDGTPSLSIAALRTRARRLKRKEGLGLIIIDYLQLMRGSNSRDGRVQEISEITRGLKSLAKELSLPIIALSQLSRNVESRDNKRPMLSDLRESGSIEQDADIVMFVYREEYYKAKERPGDNSAELGPWQQQMDELKSKAELIIGKNRHGRTAMVPLHFQHETTKFSDPVQGDFLPEEH